MKIENLKILLPLIQRPADHRIHLQLLEEHHRHWVEFDAVAFVYLVILEVFLQFVEEVAENGVTEAYSLQCPGG